MRLFELKVGERLVYLSKERWKHIATEHPSVTLENVKETLLQPSFTKSSIHDRNVNLFYRREKGRYLLVAVKFLNGSAFVITSFYVRKWKGN